MMRTSTVGRSSRSVATSPMRFSTPIPPHTRPNTVCFPAPRRRAARGRPAHTRRTRQRQACKRPRARADAPSKNGVGASVRKN